MCEQCLTDCILWSDVLPGWSLIQARHDGSEMKKGQWGLLQCNDPDFIWSGRPNEDPFAHWSEWRVDNSLPEEWATFETWVDQISKFEKELLKARSIDSFFRLGHSARKAGFKDDQSFASWLLARLGKHIRKHQPTHHSGHKLPYADEDFVRKADVQT